VIADEDDKRTFWSSYVGERIGFAVCAFEGEVARLPTEGTNVSRTKYHMEFSPTKSLRSVTASTS
jgi:hypothetical protein